MTTESLNRQLAHGHRLALGLEEQLAAVYAAQFRKIARQAAQRFRQLAVVKPITAAGDDDTPDWVAPDVDELLNQPLADARAEDAATQLHLQAIQLATPKAVKSLPEIAFDVDSPFAKPLLEAVGTKSVNLGLAARDVILKVIGDSYTAGLSVPATAAALQEQIAHLADTTALMQARTDLNGLANGASLQSVQILGEDAPQTKIWLATEDERTRETHADADGQEVPLDQPFQVGDDLLMYPGDPDGSDAEVINCRCTVIYSDNVNATEEADVTASATTTEETLAADVVASYTPPQLGVLTAAAGDPIRWRAVLIVEGEETADGRIIDIGAIDWRELPLTLMGMLETDDGHDGAAVSGRIDNIYRDPLMFNDGRVAIVGEGVFDDGDWGAEVARLVGEQMLRGVSADLGSVEIQLRPRSLPTYPAGDQEFSDYDDEVAEDPDDFLVAYVKGTLLGATVCPFPAIGSGNIEIDNGAVTASGDEVVVHVLGRGFDALEVSDSLTAAAAGATLERPPLDWFADPKLDGPTPLTIDDDGRLYGHIATWGVCHIGNPQGPNVCTTAPRDRSGYSMFHLGELITAEGDAISVGQVTLETDHAGLQMTAHEAAQHYANTGAVAAHVRTGEDNYGIWCAGAIADDLPASRIKKLRAAKLSGDWRKINGRVEMIGVLAVNIPGFPIPRPATQIRASGDVLALVAAGILGEAKPTPEMTRARIEALAARVLGREELISLALGAGDTFDGPTRVGPIARPGQPVERTTLTTRWGGKARGFFTPAETETLAVGDAVQNPPLLTGNLDDEIALQVNYLRDHGYYSDDALSQFNLDRGQLREAQRLASFLVVEPTAIQSVALQSRLIDKGLIASAEETT